MNLREWKSMTPGEWACNLALYAIGVGIMPMGVVLTINAHLGAGGYDALNFALAERLHINTSLAIYATAFLVVLLAAFIRKGYPRLETFISSFFLGIFTDMWKTILAPPCSLWRQARRRLHLQWPAISSAYSPPIPPMTWWWLSMKGG